MSDSLVTFGQMINNRSKNVHFGNRIRFGYNRVVGFKSGTTRLVRVTHGLISLVNDNHADNNLKELFLSCLF